MKLALVTFIAMTLCLVGCAFQTSKGGGIYFLVDNTSTLKRDGVEVTSVSKPDLRSIKVIGSTSAGIITGNIWAPAVVAGADSIGSGLGNAVNGAGEAVFQTQSKNAAPVAEPIPMDSSLSTNSLILEPKKY